MNDTEILGLLVYANELDGRHSPNEAKVYAWQEVLAEGAPAMTLAFARDAIRRHYSKLDVMVTPAMLVQAWRKHSAVATSARISNAATLEAHCGRADCPCQHTDCFKGWHDSDTETSPCSRCRPSLARVLAHIAPPGDRNEHDWALLRHRDFEALL